MFDKNLENRVALNLFKEGITPSQARGFLSVIFSDLVSDNIVKELADFWDAAYDMDKVYITKAAIHYGIPKTALHHYEV